MESVRVSAPGKILLFGEHAVVYGKKAVAASLNLRTECDVRVVDPSEEPEDPSRRTVTLNFPHARRRCDWADILALLSTLPSSAVGVQDVTPFSSLCEEEALAKLAGGDGSLRVTYSFLCAFALLFRQNQSADGSFDMPSLVLDVTTGLPIGAGLGSSASFCVCLASAFLAVFGVLDLFENGSEVELTEGRTVWRPDSPDLEVINKWAFEAEKILHGNPSGVDNTVATFGGALIFSHSMTLMLESTFPDLHFLITHTKVPRNTGTLVAGVRQRREAYCEVIDSLLSAINHISDKCHVLLTDPSLSQAQVENSFEDLIDINHQILNALGVGHPTLDRVCTISSEFGLHSKLTGAGGGGCAITLIPEGTSRDKLNSLRDSLEQVGFSVFDASVGSVGVVLERL